MSKNTYVLRNHPGLKNTPMLMDSVLYEPAVKAPDLGAYTAPLPVTKSVHEAREAFQKSPATLNATTFEGTGKLGGDATNVMDAQDSRKSVTRSDIPVRSGDGGADQS